MHHFFKVLQQILHYLRGMRLRREIVVEEVYGSRRFKPFIER